MPFRCSHAVGYAGWIKDKESGLMIPVRSCNLVKTPGKIFGDDLIHGSSGDEAATPIYWAWGANAYGGSINTYYMTALWDGLLKDWCLEDRCTPRSLIVSPDGVEVHEYVDCYVTSFRLASTAPTGAGGTPVDLSFDIAARTRVVSTETSASYNATGPADLDNAPVPYWRTSMSYDGFNSASVTPAVTSWSLTVRHNTFSIYVHDGQQDPGWIKQGLVIVEGECVLYHPDGVPEPVDSITEANHTPYSLTITIAKQGDVTFTTFTIPYVVITEYSKPFAGTSAPVVRTVRFRGMGDATTPAISIT